MNSDRFKKLKGDKYKAVKKNEKTKLDKRFEAFKKDDIYNKNPSEDKYGTEKRYKFKNQDFDEFYELEKEENVSEESNGPIETKPKDKSIISKDAEISSEDTDESLSDEEVTVDKKVESDESLTSDTSSSSEEEEEEEVDSLVSEDDGSEEIPPTSRLALCKIDWEHINAQDIFMLVSSFLPGEGKVLSVKIYPSEFGLEKMKEETIKGPEELLEIEKEEADPYSKKRKLIEYQKKRLKYYYAIIECDNPKTSQHIVEELNDMQFMDNILPLRFKYVPDGMTFDHAPPKSETYTEAKNYEPLKNLDKNVFQRVNFKPTWDNTDPHREQFIQKAFQNPESMEAQDLKQYLASASESSDDEQAAQEKIKLMKDLLNTESTTPFKKTNPLKIKDEKNKTAEKLKDDDMSDDGDDDFFMNDEKEEEEESMVKVEKKVKKQKKRSATPEPDESQESEEEEDSQPRKQTKGPKRIKLTVEKESAKEKKLKKKLKKKQQKNATPNPQKKSLDKFASQFKASKFAD